MKLSIELYVKHPHVLDSLRQVIYLQLVIEPSGVYTFNWNFICRLMEFFTGILKVFYFSCSVKMGTLSKYAEELPLAPDLQLSQIIP